MTIYHGNLNVLSDPSGGSVIPVTLVLSDVPADGLTIDVSTLQTPAGQPFGNIAGVTIDAGSTNVTSGFLSVLFGGGSNLLRAANGGTTQVFKAVGACTRVTLFKLAWSTGPINVILWNTPPANELVSNVNVAATITAGSVAITNSSINVVPLNSALVGNTQVNFANNAQVQIYPININGTIRTISWEACNVQAFGGEGGYLNASLQNQAGGQYHAWDIGVGPINQPYLGYQLSNLSFPFIAGLFLGIIFNPGTIVMSNKWVLNVTVGIN